MKIYIAGPYTQGDVAVNVNSAIHAGDYVSRLGHIVFIPHLSHFWHLLIPHIYDFWMAQDEAWLMECDAVLRIEGASKGADQEVKIAKAHGKRIYYSVFEIPRHDDTVLCDGGNKGA